MSDNVTAATTSYLMWLSWYPGDYKGATAFAGDCLETPAEVRALRDALAELANIAQFKKEITMSDLAMAIEDFNAESTRVQHDLAQEGVEHDHYGWKIQVDTPWAMGFVNEQGVPLS